MDEDNNDRMATQLRMCSSLASRHCDEKDLAAIWIVLEHIQKEIGESLNCYKYSAMSYEESEKHLRDKFFGTLRKSIDSITKDILEDKPVFLIDQVGGDKGNSNDGEKEETTVLGIGVAETHTLKAEGRLHSVTLYDGKLYSIDVIRRGNENIDAVFYTDCHPTFRMFGTNFRKLSCAAYAAANAYIRHKRR